MRTTIGDPMLKPFKPEQPTALDDEIKSVLDEMSRKGPLSEEYPQLMKSLERLYELKTKNRRERVSRDTMFIVGGNLAGILLIAAYEQYHPMMSKGMSFIKPLINTTNLS